MKSYDAFISYSHAKDKAIAQALQSVVQDIGRPWWKRRALRIFRDDSSLAATPHLWYEIQASLNASRYLVLLASPEAGASPWVNKEVEHWLAAKGAQSLLIALTAGDLTWDAAANNFAVGADCALPPALIGRFAAEPKWVDLRGYRDGDERASKKNPDFLTRAADLAAAIHGLPKEDLLSNELRQQRRALATAWTAAAGLAVLTVTALWQAYVADQERARVELVLSKGARTANTLVGDLAERFRSQKNIPQKFIVDVLVEARRLVDDLSATGGQRSDLVALRGRALAELSKTLRIQGRTTEALRDAEGAVAAFRDLVVREPEVTDWYLALSTSLDRLGDNSFDAGRHADAERAYREALELLERHAKGAPAATIENIAVGQEKIAELLQLQGRTDDAIDLLQKSLAAREQLARTEPDRIELTRAVNVSHGKLADALWGQGRLDAAETHQKSRVASAERLAALHPDDTALQRELGQAYRGLAVVLAERGQMSDWEPLSLKDIAIFKSLVASDPDRSDWRFEYVAATEQLGSALLKAGRSGDALTNLRESLEAAKTLAEKDTGQPAAQHTLALAHKKTGDAMRATGDPAGAADAYRTSLAIGLRLPPFPATPARWQLDIEQNFQVLCDALLELDQTAASVEIAEDRVKHFESLDRDHPQRDDLVAQALGGVAWYALIDGAYDKALAAAQSAASLRPGKTWIHLNKAHALMLSGQREAALETYLAHKSDMVSPSLSWTDAIRLDFATLRKAGRISTIMEEVEAKLRL